MMTVTMAKQTTAPTAGSSKKILKGLLLLLVLAVLAGGGFLVKKYLDLRKINRALDTRITTLSQEITLYKTNPQQAAEAEVNRYVEEIGKLYALPAEEKPSVATVKDKEQLKDQQFFARAENGDITLIYSNAKLAILYRPSTKQLVNVSSVTIQDQAQTPPAAP